MISLDSLQKELSMLLKIIFVSFKLMKCLLEVKSIVNSYVSWGCTLNHPVIGSNLFFLLRTEVITKWYTGRLRQIQDDRY